MAGSRAEQEKALLQQIAQLSGLINAAKRQQLELQQARVRPPAQPPHPASLPAHPLPPRAPTPGRPAPPPAGPGAAPRPGPGTSAHGPARPTAPRPSQPRSAPPLRPHATTQARPSHHKTWVATAARPPPHTQAPTPPRPAPPAPARTPAPSARPQLAASRPGQAAAPPGSTAKGHLTWARPGLAPAGKARRASAGAATVKLPPATAAPATGIQVAQKAAQAAGGTAGAGRRMVSIKGVHYVANANTLTRHAPLKPGEKEEGLPLRVSVQGRVFVRTGPGVYQAGPQHTARQQRPAAKGATSKVKARPAASSGAAQYCMFYNRLGHCKNEGKGCRFIHDKTKVAVCPKFVRGTCDKGASCLLTHSLDRDKMPVCLHFLRGACTREACPYSHVYVSPSAPVCQDFLKGYCALGAQCQKKHTWDCPAFVDTGSCPDGEKCRMRHPPPPRKRQADSETPASFRTKRPRPVPAATNTPAAPQAEEGEGRGLLGLEFLDDGPDGIILFGAVPSQAEGGVEDEQPKRLSLSFLDD